MLEGKKGCSPLELLQTIQILTNLLLNNETQNDANNASLVHSTLARILSDVEGVEDVEGILQNHPRNQLLPLVEFLALFIELFTPYFVEVSSLQIDGTIFFQIDEKNNEFYFSFYEDHLEFAFGNFDNFVSLTWEEIEQHLQSGEKIVPSRLGELGGEAMIDAWNGAYAAFSLIEAPVA